MAFSWRDSFVCVRVGSFCSVRWLHLRGRPNQLFFGEFSPPSARLAMRKAPSCSCDPSRGFRKKNEGDRCSSRCLGVRTKFQTTEVLRSLKWEKKTLPSKAPLPRTAIAELVSTTQHARMLHFRQKKHVTYDLLLIVTVGIDFTPPIAL